MMLSWSVNPRTKKAAREHFCCACTNVVPQAGGSDEHELGKPQHLAVRPMTQLHHFNTQSRTIVSVGLSHEEVTIKDMVKLGKTKQRGEKKTTV